MQLNIAEESTDLTNSGIANVLEKLWLESPSSLVFASLNIRGMRNVDKLTELRNIFISSHGFCVGLQETHLNSTYPDNLLSFPGCRVFQRDRTEGGGGGVMCIVSGDINVKRPEALECQMHAFKVIWLVLEIKKRHILVCNVYRYPNYDAATTAELFNKVSECYLNYAGTESIILANLNVNLNVSAHSTALSNFMKNLDLSDCVLGPTRVANNPATHTSSSTKIDYVLSTKPGSYNQAAAIDTVLSDHRFRYCSSEFELPLKRPLVVLKRRWNKLLSDPFSKFVSQLLLPYYEFYSYGDADAGITGITEIITYALDQFFP